MRKRFITALLSITVLLLSITPVGAVFSENTHYVDYEKSIVEFSTKSDIPEISTTLIVVNGGDISELTNEAALQYVKTIKSDKDGNISYTFPLKIANKDMAGSFAVYAKLPGSAIEKLFVVDYLSDIGRFTFINTFQSDVATIREFLDDGDVRRTLGIRDELYNVLDKDALATNMKDKFVEYTPQDSDDSNNVISADNFAKACEYARELVALELFNQNKPDALFDSNGNYLAEDALDFAKFDAAKGTNSYDSFKNLLSVTGKNMVKAALMGKSLANTEALHNLFVEKTVLIGLTNPKVMGYGHVGTLLSAKNCELIGLEIGTLTEEDEAKIAGENGYSSVADLENYIDGLTTTPPTTQRPVVEQGGFGGGGAVVAPKPTPEQPEEKPLWVFLDISEDHWAAEGIAYLKAKNVINGVSERYFDPNGLVTREQFAKMVFGITGLELVTHVDGIFEDTPKDIWYTDYITALSNEGIVNGVSETEFGVGQYATRQDICTIVNRILELKGTGSTQFADDYKIAEYAIDAVSALYSNNIVNGYEDGTFRPSSYCTRAEAATIIYRASKFAEVK